MRGVSFDLQDLTVLDIRQHAAVLMAEIAA
jgi:hypothetical protein